MYIFLLTLLAIMFAAGIGATVVLWQLEKLLKQDDQVGRHNTCNGQKP